MLFLHTTLKVLSFSIWDDLDIGQGGLGGAAPRVF